MEVKVHSVSCPALSTIATCIGFDVETGNAVKFGADHRMARDIGEAVEAASDDDDLPVCEVAEWQVLSSSTT